jgi:hypothetical protein
LRATSREINKNRLAEVTIMGQHQSGIV